MANTEHIRLLMKLAGASVSEARKALDAAGGDIAAAWRLIEAARAEAEAREQARRQRALQECAGSRFDTFVALYEAARQGGTAASSDAREQLLVLASQLTPGDREAAAAFLRDAALERSEHALAVICDTGLFPEPAPVVAALSSAGHLTAFLGALSLAGSMAEHGLAESLLPGLERALFEGYRPEADSARPATPAERERAAWHGRKVAAVLGRIGSLPARELLLARLEQSAGDPALQESLIAGLRETGLPISGRLRWLLGCPEASLRAEGIRRLREGAVQTRPAPPPLEPVTFDLDTEVVAAAQALARARLLLGTSQLPALDLPENRSLVRHYLRFLAAGGSGVVALARRIADLGAPASTLLRDLVELLWTPGLLPEDARADLEADVIGAKLAGDLETGSAVATLMELVSDDLRPGSPPQASNEESALRALAGAFLEGHAGALVTWLRFRTQNRLVVESGPP